MSDKSGGEAGDLESAVTRFWTWWPAVPERLRDASAPVSLSALDELARRVEDVHPKVQVSGRYVPGNSWLCLSSRGNLEIRPIVEAWARAAPKLEGWRFLTARPAAWPSPRQTPFPLDELSVVVEIEDLREIAHVTLYHAALTALEDVHRNTLAFMALDDLLGEDAVERWIGDVEVSDKPLPHAAPFENIRGLVSELASGATGKRWQAIRAGGKENPLLVAINRAIKPLDHLALHLHVRIDLQLQNPTKYGLARGKEALELDELQNELTAKLGVRAVEVARETHRGHRIIHLHTDAAAPGDINTWKQKYPQWEIQVLTQNDPSWRILRRWGAPGAEIRPSAFPPKPTP